MITMCTTRFNCQQFCILPTVYLRISHGSQHQPTDLGNGNALFSVRKELKVCSSNVSPVIFMFLAIRYVSNEAISAFVEVVIVVLIKFSCFRICINFCSQNSRGLFETDAYLVKCLCRFLVFKLSFARTSKHTTRFGRSPFTSL
jgi:hypothetical protein